MTLLALALHGFVLGDASAQEFDANGPAIPPDGASVRDPALGLGGARIGSPVASIYGHASNQLLVQQTAEGPQRTDEVALVGGLVGVTLAAQGQIVGPLGIGVTVPTWIAEGGQAGGGFTLGDMNLWVPISIAHDDTRAFGLVPVFNLPTGADARFLGDPGPGAGLLASGSINAGSLFASLDLGADYTPRTQVAEWPGGAHLRWALDLGVSPRSYVGVHAELRSRAPIASEALSLPSEALGTVKLRTAQKVFLTGSAGTAITRGVGVGDYRALLGVSIAPGDAPVEAEILAKAEVRDVHVTDDRRFPITGATVIAGGAMAQTDIEGYASLPIRALKDGELVIEHPHYENATLQVNPDDPFYEVQLDRSPVEVAVSVVGPEGALMVVEVELDGPYEPDPPLIDEAGVHRWGLRQGTWTVRMSSPGLGTQERTIVIEATRVDPIRVDAVLADAIARDNVVRVEVVDRLGRPVEDAVVALESRDLGTTGTGGDVVVRGLEAGEAALTIRSERFGKGADIQIVIDDEGDQTVQAVVDWRPGSVQVQATDPRGQPVDATVNFIGPANLPPRGVGTDGEEIFVLRPGTWEVEVTAPGLGSQVRTVDVTEDSGELVLVNVGLLPDEKGAAEVRVRVSDASGQAMPEAEVLLDGRRTGTTGPRGDLVVEGLDSGERTFTVKGPLIKSSKTTLQVVEGVQVADVVVAWVDGVTDVSAVGPDGAPLDAKVAITGPTPVASSSLGRDGADRFLLEPGEWTLTATHPGYAPQTRKLTVGAGDGRKHTVAFRMAPEGETTAVAVTVVDPRGRPVEGTVLVDGQEVGKADRGELITEGVRPGPVAVEVVAEGMRPRKVETEAVAEQTADVQVPLEWAPGALEVVVTGPGGEPVDARITLRTPEGTMPIAPRQATEGTAVIGAQPGQYQMVVEAPGMRTQVIPVDLSEQAELSTVPVEMAPRPERSGASLVIVAETERGDAIADAAVMIDGEVVGQTDAAGVVEIEGLPKKAFEMTIVPADVHVHEAITVPITVDRGTQRASVELKSTMVLPDAAREVDIVVTDPFGNPVSAEVLAIQGADAAGQAKVSPTETGTFELAPGTYTVTAITEEGALATTELVVPIGDPRAGEAAGTQAFIPGASADGTSMDGVAAVADRAGRATLSMKVEQISAAMSDGLVVPVNPVLFDTAMWNLRADAVPLVQDLARWLNNHREAALVEVGGHTDDVGGVVYNQQLSEQRARTVRAALIEYGVAPERLQARGYGLSRPVTSNLDASARQRNRRVELVVIDWSE